MRRLLPAEAGVRASRRTRQKPIIECDPTLWVASIFTIQLFTPSG